MDHRPEIVKEESWPKIPEIELKFQPCERGGVVANPEADLGILGVWNVGGELWLKDDPDMPLEEQITDIKAEVQIAFSRLILRLAAVALFERGEGLAPLVGWYEDLEETMQNKCTSGEDVTERQECPGPDNCVESKTSNGCLGCHLR